MNRQLRKENYIPVILSLSFSVVLFLLLLLPHSQYSLLEEMTLLNDTNSIEGQPLELNLLTIIPAILTLFVILINSVIFILSLLAFFMDMLFNFHLLNKINLILASILTLLEVSYLFVGINGVFDDGSRVISFPNHITVIITVLFLISLYITYIKFVDKPYQSVMKSVKEKLALNKKVEINKEDQAKEIVSNMNDDMQKTILNMLSQGKITPQEADDLLKKIHSDNC